jgi:RND family efflux transporter MFP subunit
MSNTGVPVSRRTSATRLAIVVLLAAPLAAGLAWAQSGGGGAPPPGAAPASGGQGGAGGGQPQRPPVPVVVAKAERRDTPVRLDAIGTVQTIASVTVRSRVDSQILDVQFDDGANVKAGDVLFVLDSRQIEAQIRQAEANLARDKASLGLAEADLKRAEELAKRDFSTEQRLDIARTQVATLRASVRAAEAGLDNLRVQYSYYTVIAPISGRVGAAGLKKGNIARSGDNATPLAIINQISPIYVNFSLPQRHLPDVRESIGKDGANVIATPQGFPRGSTGQVAFVDNTVDATTGTFQVRAIFANRDEHLWPGALTQVRLTLRTEPDTVVVPREAVQVSQTGSFVFVVEEGAARVRPVTVARQIDEITVIASGLKGDETVVTEGQLLLTNGARVAPRGAGGERRGPGGGDPAARPGGTPQGSAPAAGRPNNS